MRASVSRRAAFRRDDHDSIVVLGESKGSDPRRTGLGPCRCQQQQWCALEHAANLAIVRPEFIDQVAVEVFEFLLRQALIFFGHRSLFLSNYEQLNVSGEGISRVEIDLYYRHRSRLSSLSLCPRLRLRLQATRPGNNRRYRR